MAKKNSKVSLSVSEFRSWLEGVEDMQGDGWSPSLEQWKKIRNKIEMLEEIDYEELIKNSNINIPNSNTTQYVSSSTQMPMRTTPSFIDELGSNAKVTTMMPIAPHPPNSIIGSVKTPDIDTSSGTYTGSFL
jgi:hypothetical protein